jgi:hypothetical protein
MKDADDVAFVEELDPHLQQAGLAALALGRQHLPRLGGRHVHEIGDGQARTFHGHRLEQAAEQDQPDDAEPGDALPKQQGGQDRDRDQGIVAWLAARRRASAGAQDGIAGDDGDQGGEIEERRRVGRPRRCLELAIDQPAEQGSGDGQLHRLPAHALVAGQVRVVLVPVLVVFVVVEVGRRRLRAEDGVPVIGHVAFAVDAMELLDPAQQRFGHLGGAGALGMIGDQRGSRARAVALQADAAVPLQLPAHGVAQERITGKIEVKTDSAGDEEAHGHASEQSFEWEKRDPRLGHGNRDST